MIVYQYVRAKAAHFVAWRLDGTAILSWGKGHIASMPRGKNKIRSDDESILT